MTDKSSHDVVATPSQRECIITWARTYPGSGLEMCLAITTIASITKDPMVAGVLEEASRLVLQETCASLGITLKEAADEVDLFVSNGGEPSEFVVNAFKALFVEAPH